MKQIAIYSRNEIDAMRIIAYFKANNIDTKNHNGKREFKGFYFYVIDGVFGTTKILKDLTKTEIVSVNELPKLIPLRFPKPSMVDNLNKPTVVVPEIEAPKVETRGRKPKTKYPCNMMVTNDNITEYERMVLGEVTVPETNKKFYITAGATEDSLTRWFFATPVLPKFFISRAEIAKMYNIKLSQLEIKD